MLNYKIIKKGCDFMYDSVYKELFYNLNIEYYYILDLNSDVVINTLKFLDMYIVKAIDPEEKEVALYLRDCLKIYYEYDGLCPMNLSKMIWILKMFFLHNWSFKRSYKIPSKKSSLNYHLNNEKNRDLKKEIQHLEELNIIAMNEIKDLNHKKLNIKENILDGVKCENVKHDNSFLLDLIEKTDLIQRDIDYRKDLIQKLETMI